MLQQSSSHRQRPPSCHGEDLKCQLTCCAQPEGSYPMHVLLLFILLLVCKLM